MNGRMSLRLKREARKAAIRTGLRPEFVKGIYRKMKRVKKAKSYPWPKHMDIPKRKYDLR